jgi:hypothetical protein
LPGPRHVGDGPRPAEIRRRDPYDRHMLAVRGFVPLGKSRPFAA